MRTSPPTMRMTIGRMYKMMGGIIAKAPAMAEEVRPAQECVPLLLRVAAARLARVRLALRVRGARRQGSPPARPKDRLRWCFVAILRRACLRTDATRRRHPAQCAR